MQLLFILIMRFSLLCYILCFIMIFFVSLFNAYTKYIYNNNKINNNIESVLSKKNLKEV